MAAWNQTLTLAPKESFAKKMLEVLQARRKDVDARIRDIESLVAERLDAVASVECRTLLDGSKPLSDTQRAAILTFQAELAVRANQPAEARTILANLLALYPKQADPIKTKLILGQAKLRSRRRGYGRGLALLKELAAQGDTPAAATAQWELISFDLNQGVDPARTAALAKWLADHPKHFRADDARGQLLTAYLALSGQAAPPRPDSPLSDTDLAALDVADEIIKQVPVAKTRRPWSQRLLQHLATRYAARQAICRGGRGPAQAAGFAAATGIARRRPAGALPATQGHRHQASARRGEQRAAIQRRSGHTAQDLTEALAVLDAIRQEDPASPPWTIDCPTGRRCAGIQRRVCPGPTGSRPCGRRTPGPWPLPCRFSRPMPIPRPSRPQSTRFKSWSRNTSREDSQRPGDWPWTSTGSFSGPCRPRACTGPKCSRPALALLDAYAKYQFKRNIETGHGDDNAKLSETQIDLIDALAKLVAHDAAQAALRRAAPDRAPATVDRAGPLAGRRGGLCGIAKDPAGGEPLRRGTGRRAALRRIASSFATSASCGPA